MQAEFDPLEYERELEQCGFPRHQAAVQAKGLAQVAAQSVTHQELQLAVSGNDERAGGIAGDLQECRASADRRFDRVEGELKDFRVKVDQRFERVESELKDFRTNVDQRFNKLEQQCARMDHSLKLLISINLVLIAGVLFKQYFP